MVEDGREPLVVPPTSEIVRSGLDGVRVWTETAGFRVAVVGAGPAGSAATSVLGRSGISVLLLEHGLPGKDKACGDALVPSAVACLTQHGIGTKELEVLDGFPFRGIDIRCKDQLLWRHPLDESMGWIVPRAVLDQTLRDAVAGSCTIVYGATVTDVLSASPDSWQVVLRQGTLTEAVRCDGVILATGAGNRLAQRWGVCGRPLLATSISSYASVPAPEHPFFEFTESCQPGYGWVFPMAPGQINIGVCDLAPRTRSLRKMVDVYFADRGVDNHHSLRGGGGPLWSGLGKTWHHPSALLSCGDCAGLVDPMSGEGITAALLSGEHAGLAMERYLRDDRNPRWLHEYSLWVRDHFAGRYLETATRRVWRSLCALS